MHATCRRQWPRRIRYQPAEMKIVLMKFSEALMAGRSAIFKRRRTSTVQRSTSNVQSQKEARRCCLHSTLDVGRWTFDVFPMPPVLEPTPPSLARQFYRRRAKSHHSQTRRYLRIAVVAFVLILGWTSWYLAKRGFGKEWRDRVSEELHKRGVQASTPRPPSDPSPALI